ncbi:ABC transporter ATP-binding protein [Halovivax limisalsi]|uniref:ABC transporter ATP-binding protein n=1 Tax=Halovivax limisalsi TaxID=1453760 RepID=UPI001FFCEFF8|nr:ABC transporter ATP-binding protein [Halovivax limisalsi]
MTKLRVENLTKKYGALVAVSDVDFTLEEGKLQTLLGPSGCGKTTLLKCIAGLEDPTSGKIWLDGELVCDADNGMTVPTRKRNIGMVFQSYAVWPHMTVKQNVRYPLKKQNWGTKDEQQERVRYLLDVVGLGAEGDKLATNLSGGQQQRVAIARALAPEPEILLFDEPLSNLDAKLRREMRSEIKAIQKEFEVTVLYVTHSQDEAMYLSDTISILRDGEFVEHGSPQDLYASPETHFAMQFMGQCNSIDGTVSTVDEMRIATPIGDIRSDDHSAGVSPGDEVSVCFRPKHCQIDDPSSSAADANVFSGPITARSLTQDFTEYEVEIEGRSILVRTADPLSITEGDDVTVSVPTSKTRVFATGDAEQMRAQVVEH